MSNKQVKNTSPTRERASAPGVRASVTIEAAFAVPLFIFAVLSLIFLIEIQSIRGCIHAAGSDAAKQAAESTAVLPVLNTIQLKSNLVNLIGEERWYISDQLLEVLLDSGNRRDKCCYRVQDKDSGSITEKSFGEVER